MANQKGEKIKIKTGEFRVSFANVFKPRPGFQGGPPKYSVDMLFPKDGEEIKKIKAAVKKAAVSMFGDKIPKNFKNPVKDGDEKELEGYAGHFFVTATSTQKPGVVDRNLEEIQAQDEFYSGCYARATVVIAPFNFENMNFGVGVYLQNLQKLRDGQPFSGRKNAKDDFEALEELADDGNIELGGQDANDLDF